MLVMLLCTLCYYHNTQKVCALLCTIQSSLYNLECPCVNLVCASPAVVYDDADVLPLP